VLQDNPLIYYQFDETGTHTAANDGSLGTPNEGVYGPGLTLGHPSFRAGGTSPYFGTHSISLVTTLPTPNSLTAWTVEAWVKVDDLSATSGEARSQVVFTNNLPHYQDDVIFGFTPEPNNRDNRFGVNHHGAPGSSRDVAESGELLADVWYHVAATGDESTEVLAIYVNGVLAGEDRQPINGLTLNGADGLGRPVLTIGANHPDGSRQFHGFIDEVAIYDVALPPSRIAAHHSAGVIPEPSAVVLLAVGAVGLAGYRWRKRKKA